MSFNVQHLENELYLGHLRGDCSYLPGRQSSLKFLDGRGLGAGYRLLLDQGFRRHGMHVYRPDCVGCTECRILRIPTRAFSPTQSQNRVWKKGSKALRVETSAPSFTPEKAALYQKYLQMQHQSEEEIDEARYLDFFVSSFLSTTEELRVFAGDQLVGIGIIDTVGDALSSVYFFFDPDFGSYSPGTYSVLAEIQLCRQRGLSYYYPGFFISQCDAMNYKARFGPAQIKSPSDSNWTCFKTPPFGCP